MQHNVVKNGNETLHVVTRFQEQKSNYWTVGLLSGDFPSNCRGQGRKDYLLLLLWWFCRRKNRQLLIKNVEGKHPLVCVQSCNQQVELSVFWSLSTTVEQCSPSEARDAVNCHLWLQKTKQKINCIDQTWTELYTFIISRYALASTVVYPWCVKGPVWRI